MTKSFGSRNAAAAVPASKPASTPTGSSGANTRGASKSEKGTNAGLVLGLGVISAAAVGFALWALFTGQAPFLMIFFAMFVFAMVMTLVGQSLK
ncbi:MAG: hypothetical protein AAGL18_04775 [Pseudomonadota bacterium]